jgi:sialate O-acetylesterase
MLQVDGCLGNKAVLQHGRKLVIAGKATPGHQIRLIFGALTVTSLSANNGVFKFELPPMKPMGPLDVKISDIDAMQTISYKDVYIGNLYLIAGQSNMALSLGGANDIRKDYPDTLMRQLVMPKKVNVNPGYNNEISWELAENDNLKDFSAVGFHFAREVRKHSPGIAIGLVNASYGGTNIEAWISREALLNSSTTRQQVAAYEAQMSKFRQTAIQDILIRDYLEKKMLEQLFPEPFTNEGVEQDWHKNSFNDRNWAEMLLPDSWIIAGYDSPGIFWFRREIELPESWTGQALQLHLGAIDHQDITYWNGIEVGRTGKGLDISHWNDQRCYSIAPEQVKNGKNQIAVRVTSVFPICTYGGFIGPEDEMYLCTESKCKQKISLANNWKYQPEKLLSAESLERCRQLGSGEPHSYHIMFDNMIAPLQNFNFAAVVFYQGEANTLGGADKYENLLKLLVKDWRAYFAQPELPFIIVQLPGFQTPRLYSEYSQWAKVRDAQLKAGLAIDIPPVVTAESGLAYDLHPPDKSIVGKRAAMTALALQGGLVFPISGPVYKRMEKLTEGKIRLYFELYGSSLVVNGDVEHLVIAGVDGVFHKAESQLDSPETLLVWSDAVAKPEVVCYAWCENPANANIYNQAGQPASPFRTDDNAK